MSCSKFLALALALAFTFSLPAFASEGEVYTDPAVAVGEKAAGSVVQIVAEVDIRRRPVGFAKSALTGEVKREEGKWEKDVIVASGSGTVVFSGTAYHRRQERTMTLILTNHHVIAWALPENRKEIFKEYAKEDIIIDGHVARVREGAEEIAEFRIEGVRLGILVVPDQNFFIPASVEMYDETMDVALVRVDDVEGVPFARLGDSDAVRVGERLYMVGAPLGIPFQLTTGTLGQKGLTLSDKWKNLWRYEIPQASGSSGSGIFNRKGEIVAIARGSLVYPLWAGGVSIPVSIPGQHLGVPSNQIKFLLRWMGYGFVFDYDREDILDRWLESKI